MRDTALFGCGQHSAFFSDKSTDFFQTDDFIRRYLRQMAQRRRQVA